MKWNRLCVVLFAWLSVSCSLMGLDDIKTGECNQPGRGDGWCAGLGDTGNPCTTWQCGQRYCEILPRDDDGDDTPPQMCVAAGARGDCDDGDPDNAPTRNEVCDGRDNDCDGDADNGLLTSSHVALNRNATGSDSIDSIAYYDNGADVVHIYQAGLGALRTLGTIPDVALNLGAASPLSVAGIRQVDTNRYVFVFRAGGACRRFELGTVTLSTNSTSPTPVDVELLGRGLGQAWGRCDSPDAPAHDLDRIGPASLTSRGAKVLLAYLADEDPRTCGAASEADVVIGTAELNSPSTTSSTAHVAGTSIDVSAPSLIPLPRDSWAVGLIAPNGDIVIRRVTLTNLDVSSEELWRLGSNGKNRSRLTLTSGPPEENGTTKIAAAWLEDCGSRSQVVLHRLQINTGATSWTATPSQIAISTSPATRRSLALTWSITRNEWLLAWAEPSRVVGIAVSDRNLHANPEFVILNADANSEVIGDLFLFYHETGYRGAVLTRKAGRDEITALVYGC